MLAAAWLLLVGLNRGEREAEPLSGFWLGPAFSFASACAVVWLAPGYVLARLSRLADAGGGVQTLAFSFGLGLAWLCLPAAVVLVAGTHLDVLAGVVTAMNGALVLVYGWTRWRRPRAPARTETPLAPAGLALGAAAVGALAYLLAVAARRPRFSFGSDEWILMRAIRYFLEARPITYTFDFDVWDLVAALLIRLARVDLVEGYRVFLPPLLIVAASVAFLTLAETVFRDRAAACFSYLVLALYALSDMQTAGGGAGMALLVRAAEDKYVAWLVMVPLAQAAFVGFLRDGGGAALARTAGLSLAAIFTAPLAIVWLGSTCGATWVAAVATGRARPRPRVLAALFLTLVATVGVAWWLRSLRPSPYFALVDPDWPFNAVLRALNRKRLLYLAPEDGWFMAHPTLLSHPLMIAAVGSVLVFLPRFTRSLSAQFLVCSTLVPLVAVYNPLTARLLGAAITPWMIYRVVWAVPVALVLGGALHGALARIQRAWGPSAARVPAAQGRHALLWLAAAGLMYVFLAPRIGESWRALKARNRVGVSEDERALMQGLARDPNLGGRVLAPRGVGIRLPAWTSRLQPYPALDDMRWGDPARLRDWTSFYEASSVGKAEVALLRRQGIHYVITRTGTPLDQAMRALPGPFKRVYDNPSYSLYAWRPERWIAPPPSR